ncbi:Fic family protein [Fibrella arboris]|uniref:Fic family protein n=1 Tax=Fibrella arboris TaxID=3242486 RepID=UPI003520752B
MNILLERATLRLGELNSFSQFVPNIGMFIRMHVVKEATVSSRIEGTQTNIEEALLKVNDVAPERRDDWQEVNNYIMALNQALARLDSLPLSSRLLRETHETLLQGVRGQHKLPGAFRTSQNWIGGATLSDAIFIPPHHGDLGQLMGDLENFLHNEAIAVPHLIKIGIAHYQFETIHPFLDGNGRIGRLMIMLYLVSNNMLKEPILYLSDFFDRNKSLYYDNLMIVRQKHNLTQWLKFFLVGVAQTAEKAIDSLNAIMKLKQDCESRILTLGRKAPNAKRLLDNLFAQPVVTGADIAGQLGVSIVAANALLMDFERLDIVKEATGFKRNRLFLFEAYLEVFHR